MTTVSDEETDKLPITSVPHCCPSSSTHAYIFGIDSGDTAVRRTYQLSFAHRTMALYDCLTVVLSGMPNQGRGERLSIPGSVAAGTPHISFESMPTARSAQILSQVRLSWIRPAMTLRRILFRKERHWIAPGSFTVQTLWHGVVRYVR